MRQRGVPPERTAGPEQIAAALGALSEKDRLQLERYARLRITWIGWAADSRDHKDLLSEAIRKTLKGERKWNTDVPFVAFLLGVIRSESSHWAEKFATEMRSGRDRLGGEVAYGSGDEVNDRDERLHEVRETLEAVRSLFSDDALASNILAGWEDGLDGPEIQGLLSIDATAYESKVRAMRRALLRAGLKKPSAGRGR